MAGLIFLWNQGSGGVIPPTPSTPPWPLSFQTVTNARGQARGPMGRSYLNRNTPRGRAGGDNRGPGGRSTRN